MNERKSKIALTVVLAILILIMIGVLIINPNKESKVASSKETGKEVETTQPQKTENKKETNKQEIEEKKQSMQSGKLFAKIGNQTVFYQESDKGMYQYNLEKKEGSKLATLKIGADKLYFDGEYIYYMPSYYLGKGIYRMDLEGNAENIYVGSSLQLWIAEDSIYFVKQIGYDEINHNPQGTLCKMNKDGSNVVELIQNVKNNFFIQNDKLYYTTLDRKMYETNLDGTNPTLLLEGRKFTIGMDKNNLYYIDYAEQEAHHILNLTTKEDTTLGYFGTFNQFLGKTYINVREKNEEVMKEDYTFYEIGEEGKAKDLGQIVSFGETILYVTNQKAYIRKSQEGTHTIELASKKKEMLENKTANSYYLGETCYSIKTNAEGKIEVTEEKI